MDKVAGVHSVYMYMTPFLLFYLYTYLYKFRNRGYEHEHYEHFLLASNPTIRANFVDSSDSVFPPARLKCL